MVPSRVRRGVPRHQVDGRVEKRERERDEKISRSSWRMSGQKEALSAPN